MTKPKRTLYFDKRESRWVLLILDHPFVDTHKFPKTIQQESEAKKFAKRIKNPT